MILYVTIIMVYLAALSDGPRVGCLSACCVVTFHYTLRYSTRLLALCLFLSLSLPFSLSLCLSPSVAPGLW